MADLFIKEDVKTIPSKIVAEYDYTDENGRHFPSGIDSFEQLRRTFEHAVWINPIKEVDHDEWDNSGTIAEIKKVFPMHDMTLRGLENAVRELMEE